MTGRPNSLLAPARRRLTATRPRSPRAGRAPSPAAAVVAILVGAGLWMVSTGLQGSLVGLRASMESFSESAIGVLVAAYFAGFALGSARAPRLVHRLGHVRVFAALAPLAAAAVLAHAFVVAPAAWTLLRAVVGFCGAGIYVVIESWLNDSTDNTARARIFATYMMVAMGALAGGQLLLNVADPTGGTLFALASLLLLIAVVPMLASSPPHPHVLMPTPMRTRDVFAVAPLAVVGCLVAGVSWSALLGMGAVLGSAAGLTVSQISLLVGLTVVGGIIGQWPLSRASDLRDRRMVIAVAALAAAATLAAAIPRASSGWLLVAMPVFGALTVPLYPLCVTHLNDWLGRGQFVQAASTLVLMGGLGAAAGPLLLSWGLAVAGPAGFLGVLALLHLLLGLYALHRVTVRPRRPTRTPSRPVALVARVTALASLLESHRRASPGGRRGLVRRRPPCGRGHRRRAPDPRPASTVVRFPRPRPR